MMVVVLLLGGALVIYLNDRNGEDISLWERWQRELKNTPEDGENS